MAARIYTATFPMNATAALLLGMVIGCSEETTAQPPASSPSAAKQPPSQTKPENPAGQSADEARREQMLVDREQLEALLEQPNVRIVDTRPPDEYLTAHIPGAVPVDATAWTQKALEEGGLADAEYWGRAIGELGIDRDTKVIVYGGGSPTTAARIWWHLEYAGVPQVMLLDGGWELWNVGGKPTETEPVTVDPVDFEPEFEPSLLMTKEQVKEALQAPESEITVLDTRSEGEYQGKDVRGSRGGHLPSAVHCEWSEMLDVHGRFKSNEEIRQIFALRSIQPDDQLVTHCQSGGRASLELFALRMAGFDNVANFYGGWSQWSADADAPVEK